jgi:16S rRNA G966 N2-methylase RsmD
MAAADVAKRLKPITLERAKESYEELKEYKPGAQPTLTREGTKALEYFFLPHRLRAKTKRNISFMDALKDKKTYKYLLEKTRKIKKYSQLSRKKTPDEVLRNVHGSFELYYGTINQFRPAVAKWLYSKLNPTHILDFSAGWGGRALGAMSLGIQYTGIDANKRLETAYHKMLKTLDPAAPVKLYFQPSETFDFSKLHHKYDLVFTSPPYFMIEKYEGMPKYEQEQGFLDSFFVPVVKAAWTHLKPGGHLALNMPEPMYDSIKKCLPRLEKKYKMPLMDRHPGEAVRGEDLKKGKTQRHEFIYVWHKVRNTAFDEDAKGCGSMP